MTVEYLGLSYSLVRRHSLGVITAVETHPNLEGAVEVRWGLNYFQWLNYSTNIHYRNIFIQVGQFRPHRELQPQSHEAPSSAQDQMWTVQQ